VELLLARIPCHKFQDVLRAGRNPGLVSLQLYKRCDMSHFCAARRKCKGATHVVLPLCTTGCLHRTLCALQMVLRDAQAIHPPLTALTLPVELECLGLPAAERSVRGATLAVAHCCAIHVVSPFTPLFRSSIDHVLERLKVRARSTRL